MSPSNDDASVHDYLAVANEAVTAVMGDLHRTTALRPRVVVDLWMDQGVRISLDGNFTAPSMFAVERVAALAEVASYVQEQLAPEAGAWPVCVEHNAGLHPEVRDRSAMWFCHIGPHEVAQIGELGLAESG